MQDILHEPVEIGRRRAIFRHQLQAKRLQPFADRRRLDGFDHGMVELGHDRALAGPTCDGGRFVGEFGFKLQGLRERLSGREVNKD